MQVEDEQEVWMLPTPVTKNASVLLDAGRGRIDIV